MSTDTDRVPDAAGSTDPADPLDLDEPADADRPAWPDQHSRPDRPAAVHGRGGPRRHRWRTAAGALALALAAGLLTWQRTSAVDAARVRDQQGRAFSVVVAGGGLLVGEAPDSGDYNARATLELDLVNAGALPVQVLRITPGEAAALMTSDITAPRSIAPAAVEQVVVAGPVSCPLGALARSRTLRLVLRSADGARHEVEVDSPPGWTEGLRRTCALRAGAAPL